MPGSPSSHPQAPASACLSQTYQNLEEFSAWGQHTMLENRARDLEGKQTWEQSNNVFAKLTSGQQVAQKGQV